MEVVRIGKIPNGSGPVFIKVWVKFQAIAICLGKIGDVAAAKYNFRIWIIFYVAFEASSN
ncbi:hypothetical protein D5275_05540 [Adlercreutzia muris]|nr:hypothetical protein [Adlercreutzia muris]